MTPIGPEVEVPMQLPSLANARMHWAQRAKLAKAQRSVARLAMKAAHPVIELSATHRLVVRMTRVAPRRLDSDNLASACKHARDGVADFLGIDDGAEWVRWEYAQTKGAAKLRVEMWLENAREGLCLPRGEANGVKTWRGRGPTPDDVVKASRKLAANLVRNRKDGA